MRRELDEIEQLFPPLELNCMFAAKYHGHLQISSLEKAFRMLTLRHPVLRGFIESDGHPNCITVDESDCSKFMVTDGDEDDLLLQYGSDYGGRLSRPGEYRENGSALAWVHVFRQSSEGYIVFVVNHTLVDGPALHSLLDELWSIYTSIADGKDPASPEDRHLPESPMSLIRKGWRDYRIDPGPDIQSVDLDKIENGRTSAIFLTRQETDRLKLYASERGLTVSKLLLAEAVSILWNRSLLSTSNVRINAVVNLRPYLSPPVRPTETTYLCGQCSVDIDISNEKDRLAVGTKFKENLSAAIAEKRVVIPGFDIPYVNLRNNADVFFNNVGVLGEFVTPDGLQLTELFQPMYRRDQVFPRTVGAPPVVIFSMTFGGQTQIVCTHADSLIGFSNEMKSRVKV